MGARLGSGALLFGALPPRRPARVLNRSPARRFAGAGGEHLADKSDGDEIPASGGPKSRAGEEADEERCENRDARSGGAQPLDDGGFAFGLQPIGALDSFGHFTPGLGGAKIAIADIVEGGRGCGGIGGIGLIAKNLCLTQSNLRSGERKRRAGKGPPADVRPTAD